MPVPKQRVVVYEHDGATRVYATAYDDEQVLEVLMDCAKRHGREAYVRAVDAQLIPPPAAPPVEPPATA